MRFWPKDHPDEIEIGDGIDFPPPFRPENAPGARAPPAQIAKEQSSSSRDGNKIKRRDWFKRTLGLGNITPPPPGSYEYDPQAEALQKLKLEARKAPKIKPSGRFFDNQGREITGKPVPRCAVATPKSDQSSTASRPARAEPRTMHWTAALGVGGPGAGFTSQNLSAASAAAKRHHHDSTASGAFTLSRQTTTTSLFLSLPLPSLTFPSTTASMFTIGPDGSSNSSRLSSSAASFSKESEWSTGPESHDEAESPPEVPPKFTPSRTTPRIRTPQRSLSQGFNSNAKSFWSDTSEESMTARKVTPVTNNPRKIIPQRSASQRHRAQVDYVATPSKSRAFKRYGMSSNDARAEVENLLFSGSDYASDAETKYSVREEDSDSNRSASEESSIVEALLPPPLMKHYYREPPMWQYKPRFTVPYDSSKVDPLSLGTIPVRPLPPLAIHADFQTHRENWGLPLLRLRCIHDSRRHPHHSYAWNAHKLNCYGEHEGDCQLCGSSCCSIRAYTKLINEDPRPNPVIPPKYREMYQNDIDKVEALKPLATDMFERMLKCSDCYRNVCPDCAGRCMRPDCLRAICKSCGHPDPWIHCQCNGGAKGQTKISYLD
ncbi:hypothetical protein E4T39_06453 [Aureobasidium subglaciale]|nr:hypothetical protein E4T39_06453 [Aureobasidium subglaciale]